MKYIKTYENLIPNIFKKEYTERDYCFWNGDEVEKIRLAGFDWIKDPISRQFRYPFYYESVSEDLIIKIEKIQKISLSFKFGDIDWKYIVTITKNGKDEKKSFNKNKFDEMLNFAKKDIPEIDKYVNKYNL